MVINREDVIKRLESLGYAPDENDSALIEFSMYGAIQYIKNFCNITIIPEELYYVAVDMAAGNFLRTKVSIGEPVSDNIDFDTGRTNSITEGDVSISYNYDGNTSKEAMFTALLDSLCNKDAELVTFRKLRW
jgi:hypothetical protein